MSKAVGHLLGNDVLVWSAEGQHELACFNGIIFVCVMMVCRCGMVENPVAHSGQFRGYTPSEPQTKPPAGSTPLAAT